MARPLFIFQGNGTYLNRGCEAITRATVAILRKEFGPATYINAPTLWIYDRAFREEDPEIKHVLPPYMRRWSGQWIGYQFRKRLGLRVPEPYEKYLPRALATLALGGDNYSLSYGRPTRYFEANRVTLGRGTPLVIWGASVGPFSEDPEFERWAAEELKRVTLICARESETITYLKSINVSDNVRAVSDPAFALEPLPAELSEAEQRVLDGPCVGLNFSPLLDRYWAGETPLVECVRRCIEAVLDELGRPVVLVPHVVYAGSDDHAFMGQVLAQLRRSETEVVLLDARHNARQLKWIISKLRLFAGARTHATIAALSSGVPTISIGYSMKSRGINKDLFGHSEWVLPLERLSAGELAAKLKALDAAHDEVKAHLDRIMPDYRQRAFAAAAYVREAVEQRPR